jgi:hypothetical protein
MPPVPDSWTRETHRLNSRMLAWVKRVDNGTAQVGDSRWNGHRISTVFYPCEEDGMNYETRIFPPIGDNWRVMWYCTQAEAEVGHYWAVMQLIYTNGARPNNDAGWEIINALMHGVCIGEGEQVAKRNKDDDEDPPAIGPGMIQGMMMGAEKRGEIPEGTVEKVYGTGEEDSG